MSDLNLCRDTIERMEESKKILQESTKNMRMGHLVDNVLHLAQQNEEDSSEFYLKDFKGTQEYRKKLNTETYWRKVQNGQNVVKINKKVYSGFLDNDLLAKIMLTMEGIKVIQMGQPDELLLVVPCQTADNVCCNVSKCKETHKTAREAALEIFPNGVIPNDKLFPVSHYVQKYVEILINSHLKRISTNYDLKLVFYRSGEIYLRGNLWIRALERCNLTGATGSQSDLSTIFQTDEYQLSGGVEDNSEEESISPELEPLLGQAESASLREASLMEAFFCNGRPFKMRRASQDVQKLDIRDEEMVT